MSDGPTGNARPVTFVVRLLLGLSLLAPLLGARCAWAAASPPDRGSRVQASLPLLFEANRGQASPEILYLARSGGAEYLFSPSGVTIRWTDAPPGTAAPAAGAGSPAGARPATTPPGPGGEAQLKSHTLRLGFGGASASQAPIALQEQVGRVNYFAGSDPALWRTDIPTYGRLLYTGLYPGIDLVFYGTEGHLEFDLVVAPGADPSRVKLAFDGGEGSEVRLEAGEVLLGGNPSGPRLLRPLVYQERDGVRRQIPGDYRLGQGALTLKLGAYDRRQPLVIDPVLAYFGTYLGGSNSDYGYSVAVDGQGNIYIGGLTFSSDFPVVGGIGGTGSSAAGFVTKLDPSGTTLIYSTLLKSSSSTAVEGLAVDGNGAVYVVGYCGSAFPLVSAYQSTFGGLQDAFVAKLNPAGNALLFSTYLGGNQWDQAQKVAADGSGNCVVAGYTQSGNFPTLSPFQSTLKSTAGNGFAARYGPTGTLLWSTFLGGSSPYGDRASGVAVDGSGNAYVCGYTYSNDFPTVSPYQGACKGCAFGYQDAFLTAFNPSGAAIYSTFFGGNSATSGSAVAADSAGNAFLGGQTWCTDLPVTPGAPQPYAGGGGVSDGFIAEFNPAGSQVLACTYLGGSNTDYVTGLSLAAPPSGPGILGVVGVTNSALDNALPAARDSSPPATALGTLFAHPNNGSGGFSCDIFNTAPGLPLSSRPLGGDFNGDGFDDVAVLVPSQSEVYTLLNSGTGTFGPPVISATRSFLPTDAVVTDFDGDGHRDLVVACRQSLADPSKGAFNILYGRGDGTFVPAGPEWPVTGQPIGIAVGDVNGDSVPDVVVAEQTSSGGVLSTFLQDPVYLGGFLPPVTTDVPGLVPIKMAPIDYNHDGKMDVALLYPLNPGGYFSADSVGIFSGDGAGHFATATTLSTGIWPRDMAVADFNGDGVQDLAVLNYGDGTLSLFGGLAPGPGFAAPVVLNTQGAYSYPENLFVGNLHPSAPPDLVVTFPVTGSTAQIFTNTSPPGGPLSFTPSNFGCHQPAFVGFGHFFSAGPFSPSAPSDLVVLGGPFFDTTFKQIVQTSTTFIPLFSTVESTGLCNTHGAGIAVDATGRAFVTGDSVNGGIPIFPSAFPYHGGSNDAFLTIEQPQRPEICRCRADRYLGDYQQFEIVDTKLCYPMQGPMPRAESYPACPSPSVTIDPGDGSPATAGDTLVHTYAQGTYDFTVTEDYGGGDIKQCVGRVEIVVPPCAISCNTTVPAFACVGASAAFLSNPLAEGVSCPSGSWTYDWDFGDGSPHATTQNAAHAYGGAGTYHWSLTLTFADLTRTCRGDIQVCGLNCSVNALTPAGCAPLTTSFFLEIGQVGCVGDLSYDWDFGDGTTSTAPSPPPHTYNAPGKYTWHVTITGVNGCSCTSSGTICVYNFPPASVPASGFANCSVPFLGTADVPQGCSGTPNFSWTFGDGASGVGGSTSHKYAAAGTYTWTLTVSIGGVTCQQSGTITICTFNCVANASTAVAFAPVDVTFTSNGVITGGCAGVVTYLWDFGDGTTSTAQNPPAHTYDTPGTYNWTLTAKVDGACPSVCSGTVCVVDCWAHGPGAVCAGGIANFSASGLPGNCPANISWAWTFGDGGTSTDQNPAYAYPNLAQTYNWSCTITVNGIPCTKNGATAVCKPVCTVNVPTTGGTGIAVDFSGHLNAGNCAGAPVTFLWNFGDPASGGGNTSTSENATHTYTTPGTYTWTFTGNLVNCLCISSGTITIEPVCVLQCSANAPAVGMTGMQANFAATALPAYCPANPAFQWTFGDGGTSTSQNPAHTFAAPGVYHWTMTASIPGTTVTCSKTGTITVVNPPVVTLMKKVAPPFKIVVTGGNLQNGIKVYIDGVQWGSVVWKNLGKIQLTGSGLKAAVPKGVSKQFRFVNPDGGEVTLTWNW